MRRITKISCQQPFVLICTFDNNEVRILDLEKVLDKNEKFAKNILKKEVFKTAKIGDFGEVYWENMAEIRLLDGSLKSCQYDISPEFAYLYSTAKVQTM